MDRLEGMDGAGSDGWAGVRILTVMVRAEESGLMGTISIDRASGETRALGE